MTEATPKIPSAGLIDLPVFRFRPALLDATSTKFTAGKVLADGQPEWTLTGHPGTYLVERKSMSFTWIPIALATNQTGTVKFDDPLKPSELTFYRARRYE